MRISDWSSDVCFFRSGCDGFDPGNLLRNGVHVRHFESGRTRPAAAAPKALAWADLQDVGAQAADLFLYGGGCAVAQGHHRNDRGQADDDPYNRWEGTQKVPTYLTNGKHGTRRRSIRETEVKT